MADQPTPDEQVRRLYEEAEAATGGAMERLVSRQAFAELLGMAAENTVAIIKLGSDAADLAVRNLRLAGRRDLTRLAKQIARTEDKLERVLQEIEALRAEQRADGAGGSGNGQASSASRAGTASRSAPRSRSSKPSSSSSS
jgi:hypothetical protein